MCRRTSSSRRSWFSRRCAVPNMRAITVAVDAVSGTAGLIWPGDRVDLILTQALERPNAGGGATGGCGNGAVGCESDRCRSADCAGTGAGWHRGPRQSHRHPGGDGGCRPNACWSRDVLGKLSLSVLSADRECGHRVLTGHLAATATAAPLATRFEKLSLLSAESSGIESRPTVSATRRRDLGGGRLASARQR